MKNLKKKLYIAFGFLAVTLAILGVFIPGLPTVPFLLVALFCFERSSKKYHDMIMNILVLYYKIIIQEKV